jgi:hypothetical protein
LIGRAAGIYAAQKNPESEAMKLTWGERMAAEYEQRGLEKGRKEGTRQALLRLLGKRFGEVSPAVRKRVEAISSIEELGGLVDRTLEVRSIDELGLGS